MIVEDLFAGGVLAPEKAFGNDAVDIAFGQLRLLLQNIVLGVIGSCCCSQRMKLVSVLVSLHGHLENDEALEIGILREFVKGTGFAIIRRRALGADVAARVKRQNFLVKGSALLGFMRGAERPGARSFDVLGCVV